MKGKEEHPIVSCWKEIGVSGNFSCSRLSELVHCRNCEEYNRAGRQLFDREIPKEFLEEWTRSLKDAKEDLAPEAMSVIIFRIRNEWLALRTVYLQEAVNVRPVHHVPLRTNNVFRGVVNVNGELLLCVSLVDLLEHSEHGPEQDEKQRESKTYERMLVVRIGGERYVFPVDEVFGICRVPLTGLFEPPVTMTKSSVSLVKGIFEVAESRIGLLDEDRLLESMKRSLTA